MRVQPHTLLLCSLVALGGTACNRPSKVRRYPPRSYDVVKILHWQGLVLRLPPKWQAEGGKTLTWTSSEDLKCRAVLEPIRFQPASDVDQELVSIAKYLGCSVAEVSQRKGFFGAEIFYIESKSTGTAPEVSVRSLARCDGRWFRHDASYAYGQPIEKHRGAELWMILYWFGLPDERDRQVPLDPGA